MTTDSQQPAEAEQHEDDGPPVEDRLGLENVEAVKRPQTAEHAQDQTEDHASGDAAAGHGAPDVDRHAPTFPPIHPRLIHHDAPPVALPSARHPRSAATATAS